MSFVPASRGRGTPEARGRDSLPASHPWLARRSRRRRGTRAPRRPLAGPGLQAAGGAALLLAAFAAGVALHGPALAALVAWLPEGLERVACVGCTRVDPQALAATADLPAGTKLSGLDVAGLVARLEQHAWITEARALALPPATLLIGVREREPLAVVPAGAGEAARLLDADATPFAPAAPADLEALPRIVAARGAGSDALAAGVRVARALAARPTLPPAREIAVGAPEDPAYPALRLRGVAAPVMLGPGDLPEKLDRLARLLDAGPPELLESERIDLRFAERAILRISPSRTGTDQRREGADATSRPNRDPAEAGGPTPGG